MFLVDGNNVMGERVGWHRDKPAAQRRLLMELAALKRRRHQAVTVVFDGRPPNGITDGSDLDGVTVYFALPGSDADERIVELAQNTLEAREILAVTSDRELIDRLQQLDVKTMRSGQFRRLLEELSSHPNQ
jgi:predicted RNA-binding protein with PIN domain